MIIFIAAFALVILYIIYTRIQETYLVKDPIIQRLIKKLTPVFPELRRVKVMRSLSTSYTLNKYRVYICVRNQATGRTFSDNILTYVLLHELAHALNVNYGHGSTYQSIFRSLLNRAESSNLYKYVYVPTNYCSNPNFPHGQYQTSNDEHPYWPLLPGYHREPTTAN